MKESSHMKKLLSVLRKQLGKCQQKIVRTQADIDEFYED